MMRHFCRKDLRALDFEYEACDSSVSISKGNVKHYKNETIVEYKGCMYTIQEGDDDLGCFLDIVLDEDGSFLEKLADDHTNFNKEIEREELEDYVAEVAETEARAVTFKNEKNKTVKISDDLKL